MSRYGKAVIILLFMLHSISPEVLGGGEVREGGVRSAGMGSAGVALSGDAWSMTRNPSLISVNGSQGAASWTPSRFGLGDLESAGIAWLQDIGETSVGASVTRVGNELYRELTPSLSLGMMTVPDLMLGLRVSLLCLAIERYGSAVIPLFDAGVTLKAHPALQIAACASNVTQASITGVVRDRVPSHLRIGACWQPDASMLMQLELDKEMRWPMMTRAGIELRPVEAVALRTGVTMQPWTVSAGFAIEFNGILADVAMSWHPDLGATHMLGIGIRP